MTGWSLTYPYENVGKTVKQCHKPPMTTGNGLDGLYDLQLVGG